MGTTGGTGKKSNSVERKDISGKGNAIAAATQRIIEDSGLLSLSSQDIDKEVEKGEWTQAYVQEIEIRWGEHGITLRAPSSCHKPVELLPSALRKLHAAATQFEQLLLPLFQEGAKPFAEARPAAPSEGEASSCAEQQHQKRPRVGPVPSHVRSLASIPPRVIDCRGEGQAPKGQATEASASDVRSVATSDVPLTTTAHAKQRLEERGLTERQLQAALKHASHQALPGKPSEAMPDQPTSLIEHDGIVVCTDQSMNAAITAWPAVLSARPNEGLTPRAAPQAGMAEASIK